jgi:hypothetical protein
MKATTIKLAMYDSGTKSHTQMLPVPAYFVPGTNDTLAVHHPAHHIGLNCYEPGERHWCVTHVPTGFSLGFTKPTRSAAIAYALEMHAVARKRRVPLKSADHQRLAKRWARALADCGIKLRAVA